MQKYFNHFFLVFFLALLSLGNTAQANVRLKDLARFEGVRTNSLVGYGLVVGLAGTGDSSRNRSTIQSLSNALQTFDVLVSDRDIGSRNVAAVIVTATLPPFSEKGDQIDVQVSSLGDAKSLVGGTLLMVPLKAANDAIFALAQGPLSVGGFKYDMFGNLVQKNHPTVGIVPNGATIERSTNDRIVNDQGRVHLILNEPDFTTAERIVAAIETQFPHLELSPVHAGKIEIDTQHLNRRGLFRLFSSLEKLRVAPDVAARVIVNERTGTLVAGGNVTLGAVTVSHGELKVEIRTDFNVSQPQFIGSNFSDAIETRVLPDSEIKVTEQNAQAVSVASGTSVTELVDALRRMKVSTRDVIAILQSIKQAGALHADLIIQ
ncbi:MAG: flagellar basal body P-ring protein FlgI [Pseudomonadota bacterium]